MDLWRKRQKQKFVTVCQKCLSIFVSRLVIYIMSSLFWPLYLWYIY